MTESKNIFEISIETVQMEAEELINRRLTDDEMHTVKKGIEWGLLTAIDIVYRTAIEEAIKSNES